MKKEWPRVLTLVRKIERKYGSVTKAPSTDEDLQLLHQIYATKGNKATDKIPKKEVANILEDIKAGYRTRYIAKKYHYSDSVIYRIADANGVSFKPVFRYELTKNDGHNYYFNSIIPAAKLILNKKYATASEATQALEAKGYRLQLKNVIWKNVPLGSYYMATQHTYFHYKATPTDYMTD